MTVFGAKPIRRLNSDRSRRTLGIVKRPSSPGRAEGGADDLDAHIRETGAVRGVDDPTDDPASGERSGRLSRRRSTLWRQQRQREDAALLTNEVMASRGER